jgi:hypothetical protein
LPSLTIGHFERERRISIVSELRYAFYWFDSFFHVLPIDRVSIAGFSDGDCVFDRFDRISLVSGSAACEMDAEFGVSAGEEYRADIFFRQIFFQHRIGKCVALMFVKDWKSDLQVYRLF